MKAATDLQINGSKLFNRNKIFNFTSKSSKKYFDNDFIKKFVAKRIIQSARKHKTNIKHKTTDHKGRN